VTDNPSNLGNYVTADSQTQRTCTSSAAPTIPAPRSHTRSTLTAPRASATQLTRIKNWAQVTGVYVDALTAEHGLTGQ
jgi:hypothetical protein